MGKLANNYSTYIASQLKYLKDNSQPKDGLVNPFITISRETGAYGVTISEGLSAYLNKKDKNKPCPWTVFDKNIIKNITEDKHLPESIRPYLTGSNIKDIKEIMNEIFNGDFSKHLNVQNSCNTILQLAQLGHAIFVGCASSVITARLPGGIHVRLISPFENRVEHIQEYYPMSEKEAREYIFAEEGNRKEFLKKYFKKDVDDPLLYNMVINVDVLEPEDIIQMIGDLVLKRSHQR